MNIHGKLTDDFTRCAHYHSPLDIIAIKFKCCNSYYACIHCHEELANHPAQVWPEQEFDNKAILCGNCKHELTIDEYFKSGYRCPKCSSDFNPKCNNHNHFYFKMNAP
ncbi:MAG: CHY zinc finger protein [Ferruginibacter sp.]